MRLLSLKPAFITSPSILGQSNDQRINWHNLRERTRAVPEEDERVEQNSARWRVSRACSDVAGKLRPRKSQERRGKRNSELLAELREGAGGGRLREARLSREASPRDESWYVKLSTATTCIMAAQLPLSLS